MGKVVFYTDKPGTKHPAREIVDAILTHFNTNQAYWCCATPTVGFESGVDWDSLEQEGAIAVVLYDVNDACTFGISLEADENAGLPTYELFHNQLLKCSRLQVAGKELVLEIQRTQPDKDSRRHLHDAIDQI
jgi:hypothetical protein